MNKTNSHTIKIKGDRMDLSKAQVRGILNDKPDSCYGGCRQQGEKEIEGKAIRIISEGAAIIDLGTDATRPE